MPPCGIKIHLAIILATSGGATGAGTLLLIGGIWFFNFQ
jgi:hypothetical protein